MAGNGKSSHYLQDAEENRLYSKKKTFGYQERDGQKRQAFARLKPVQIIDRDESGIDEGDDNDDYGVELRQTTHSSYCRRFS